MNFTTYLANKTNMINKRCEELVDDIYKEYKSGELSTELDYVYKAKNTIKDFYSKLGKPSFELTKANSTPTSKHYNEMVNKAYNDIELVINETNTLNDVINISYDEMKSYTNTYNSIIKKVGNELDVVQNNIRSLKAESQYIFSDSFDSLDYIRNISSKDSVNVKQAEGVMTLNYETERDYSNILNLEILEGSNGFPGNTHEVEVLNNKMSFKGQNDARIELSNMLDQKKSTWFEYELYNMSDLEYSKTNGFGFSYKEGISWLVKENKLILNLKISLRETRVCNWISLTPFIPNNKNTKSSMIKKVTITDGNFLTQEYIPNKEFNDTYVVNFEPQTIKDIIIEFEQSSTYETDIGHIYTIKNNSNDLYFDNLKDELYKRVDIFNPSLSALGVKYDPNSNKYILPKYNGDKTSFTQNNLNKEVFTVPFDYGSFESNVEILKANRYMIGIKNVTVGNYSYNEKSIYVSEKFTTDENIMFVELESKDYIPNDFKQYRTNLDEEYTGEDFLKYEITFDEGNVWYPIMPKHKVRFYPCAYAINSDILPSMRKNHSVKYIERFLETKSVTIRITLNRPEELIYDTPIVYNYKLSVKTESGDNFAYNK